MDRRGVVMSQSHWNVEIQKISFSDSDSEDVTFTNLHKNIPYVIPASSDLQEDGTPGQGNINLFVSEIMLNSCKINASSRFTGTVHLKIISVIA
tara:strand:+ start:42 stop:323 length:282 start_codon:yes stop_codon:yes gene_type:complete